MRRPAPGLGRDLGAEERRLAFPRPGQAPGLRPGRGQAGGLCMTQLGANYSCRGCGGHAPTLGSERCLFRQGLPHGRAVPSPTGPQG